MMHEDIYILIIDDDLKESHPVVVFLRKDYPNVKLIRKTTQAVEYVKQNLEKNLILILDYHFDNDKDGDWALKKIRELSDLIPVILFTAEYPRDKFKDFINLKTLAFARKGDYEDVASKVEDARRKMKPFVEKAEIEWETSVAGILEELIEIKKKDRRKRNYYIKMNGKDFSLEELLSEIRNNTPLGKEFDKALKQTTIKQLVKGGIKLEEILVIDDRLTQTDPIIIKLQKRFSINTELRATPQEGVDYVVNNLGKIMVIILDYKFSAGDPNGSWVIKKIREHSQIIPIILMSVQGNNIDDYDEFINNNTLAFADQSDYENVVSKVEEAEEYWQRVIAGAYESWILSQDDAQKEQPYLAFADKRTLSLNELLKEVMEQTTLGQNIMKDLNMATMDLLLRNKLQLDA